MERVWKKGKPYTLLVGMLIGMAIMENSMEVPQKLRIELPYDPTIPLLSVYSKEMKSLSQKDIYTPMFTAALTSAKIWKQLCP